MKLYIVLILATVLIAFSTAFFLQDLGEDISPIKEDILTINQIKLSFQEKVLPVKIVNFSSLYYNRDRLQLIDPTYTAASGSFIGIENLFHKDEKCFEARNFLRNYDNYDKVWIWEEFRCGMRKLPTNFFLPPPYMHPSGKSYSLLAFLSMKENYRELKWIKSNITFFHILEYEYLQNILPELDYVYTLFSKLEPSSLSSIIKAKGTILGTNFLLARIKYSSLFPILEYRFYERSDLDDFLQDSPYAVKNHVPGQECFYKDGSLCWDYSFTYLLQNANKRNVIFITISAALTIFIAITLFNKIKAQRIEDERRRVALQVLTHEFRTPVTSLLLTLENLNSNIDPHNSVLQDIYLKLSKETYRLKNLTEMSRNYLKTSRKNAVIEYRLQEIDDLNEIIEDILQSYTERYQERFTVKLDEKTKKLNLDPYWFSIAFKNLVENAITHGKGHITILSSCEEGKYSLSVSDEGSINKENISKLTSEFFKGTKSTGTGLGLNIVERSIEGMGGKLTITTNPTTFNIEFKVV